MMKQLDLLPTERLDLSALAGQPVLAGRRQGEQDWIQVDNALRHHPGAALVVIDLESVEVLSSSYFSAALWPLWKPRHRWCFPLLARPSLAVLDELEFVVRHLDLLVWLDEGDDSKPPELLGEPDEETRSVVDVVVAGSEVSAADLHSANAGIGVTAWSNRLSLLTQRKVLTRRKEGKRMIYRAPWSGYYG